MKKNFFKKHFLKIYLCVTVILFLLRVILFAGKFGGVEHDSGWYLGVARNLAERGIYASYTNTVVYEGAGDFPSIHGRFSVQDENGFSYFPAGVTVGPGYVIPEALIIKIFGFGWWQTRAWPIITFTLLLILLFILVYLIGGFISLLIFQAWLWLYPQLTINVSFESFSESIALLYVLSAFFLFYLFIKNRKKLLIFGSGIFISLAFLTKNLYALSILAFVPFVFKEFLAQKRKIWKFLGQWALFALGCLLPFLLFEGYRYFSLTSQFGKAGYQAINNDIKLTFEMGGSGIKFSSLKNLDVNLFNRKVLIWSDLGILRFKPPWFLFLLTPFFITPFIGKNRRMLFFLIYIFSLVSFAWFVFFSTTGWGRHIWQGIILGMVIFSASAGNLLSSKKFFWPAKFSFIPLFLIILLPSFINKNVNSKFILEQEDIERFRRISSYRVLQGFPSNQIFPLKDQEETMVFLKTEINPEDKIYYHSGFLVSEMSALADKVFYPLNRYFINPANYLNEYKSYLIFGPFQKGKLNLAAPDYFNLMQKKYCSKNIFENDSYAVCLLN